MEENDLRRLYRKMAKGPRTLLLISGSTALFVGSLAFALQSPSYGMMQIIQFLMNVLFGIVLLFAYVIIEKTPLFAIVAGGVSGIVLTLAGNEPGVFSGILGLLATTWFSVRTLAEGVGEGRFLT